MSADKHTWPPFAPGAIALWRDWRGRILLVKPNYHEVDRGWYLPGGACLPGEDFDDALVREIWEETGLRRVAGRLLVTENVAARPGKPPGVNVMFDVEDLRPAEWPALRLPADELSHAQLVAPEDITTTPSDTHPWVLPALARRIRTGLEALASGEHRFLKSMP